MKKPIKFDEYLSSSGNFYVLMVLKLFNFLNAFFCILTA